MFSLFLAAELLAAHPSNVNTLFTADDVPVALLPLNRAQVVGIALVAGPDGKVRSCNVEKTSGNPKLDSYTCTLAARRAKFSPAQTYFVERTYVSWWNGDGCPPKSNYGNLYVTLAELPANLHSPVLVHVLFAVDEAGNMSRCQLGKAEEPADLVPIACEQLAKVFRPQPARSETGNPVASEQDATVMFQAK
jgi:hypothetical protein